MSQIIILTSGIADLVTAISALQSSGRWQDVQPSDITAVIAGHGVSLPDNLIAAFHKIARKAFGLEKIEAFRWGEDDASLADFVAAQLPGKTLLSNQLQDARQRKLIASLKPGKFIFFDNGLSSYHSHNIDLRAWRALLDHCEEFSAYLTYMNLFGVPAYLDIFNVSSIPPDTLQLVSGQVRDAVLSNADLLPEHAVVILGTSFDRTDIISTEEERTLHLMLLRYVREKHDGPVFFKPHPRAGSVYLDETAGVTLLSTEIPVESYVNCTKGFAYSYSSTALFSLDMMFDWETFRVSHPLIERIFSAKPQIAKITKKQVAHFF